MIVTMTLNPSVDYVVKLEELAPGALNRSTEVGYFPGGKGINVSQVLQQLGADTVAAGFTGGFSGKFIESSLQENGIPTNFIQVNEPTRINIKLKTNEETDINADGPAIDPQQLDALLDSLSRYGKSDILVLAGSKPKSLPDNVYLKIAEKAAGLGMKVVIDAERALLEPALAVPLHLIKPNHHELGDFFNVAINSIEDAVTYGRRLLQYPVEQVMVSMAGDGAVLITKEQVYHAMPPAGKLVNSVGAGDSAVAGFLAGEERGLPLPEVLKLSTAAGSATAFSEGLATKDGIESLLPQITVTELQEQGDSHENH